MKDIKVLDVVTMALFVAGITITIFYEGSSVQETSVSQIAEVAVEQNQPVELVN